MQVRYLVPVEAIGLNLALNGRGYRFHIAGVLFDAPAEDAIVLDGVYCRIGFSGPTAARPIRSLQDSNDPPRSGTRYFDTDLGKMLMHDGERWRDINTGLAV